MTVEIGYEPGDDLLAAEMQTVSSVITKYVP